MLGVLVKRLLQATSENTVDPCQDQRSQHELPLQASKQASRQASQQASNAFTYHGRQSKHHSIRLLDQSGQERQIHQMSLVSLKDFVFQRFHCPDQPTLNSEATSSFSQRTWTRQHQTPRESRHPRHAARAAHGCECHHTVCNRRANKQHHTFHHEKNINNAETKF